MNDMKKPLGKSLCGSLTGVYEKEAIFMSEEKIETTSDHIAKIVEASMPGAMVTKYFLVTEVIDKNGGRVLDIFNSQGSTVWDDMGLVEFARMQVKLAAAIDGECTCPPEEHGDESP